MSDEKREAIRKKLLEQRAVEDHWLNGGEVQVVRLTKDGTCWVDAVEPDFLWCKYEYRIKPKPLEFWLVVPPVIHHHTMAFETREQAQPFKSSDARVVHVREVVE